MWIISRSTLAAYGKLHPDAEAALRSWLSEARKARWTSPHEVTARYPKARTSSNDRAVFHISGNRYRLVVRILYATADRGGQVSIRFIGTHKEYDSINAEEV